MQHIVITGRAFLQFWGVFVGIGFPIPAKHKVLPLVAVITGRNKVLGRSWYWCIIKIWINIVQEKLCFKLFSQVCFFTHGTLISFFIAFIGKWLACQSMDNQILIFGAQNRFRLNKKKIFKGHMVAGYACQVDFSPDMRWVLWERVSL